MSSALPPPKSLLRTPAVTQPASLAETAAEQARPSALPVRLGWLPVLSVVAAAGLIVMALADVLASARPGAGQSLLWVSLLVIIVPIVFRLLARRLSRTERMGLVILFGMALFVVKIMQSPFGFTYPDEFVHQYNVHEIYATGRLFVPNPILPASNLYPGLESFTAGLRQLTGLDEFTAGLAVIGAARLIMMAGLFLLYEQVTHSPRLASLGSVLYAGNANFLFWSVQFSYESLALPLAILVLFAVARREDGADAVERLGLTILALAGICTVVVTHHLSSYFLAGALGIWTLAASRFRLTLYRLIGRGLAWFARSRLGRRVMPIIRPMAGRAAWAAPATGAATGGPGGLALFAAVAAMVWLVFVAAFTLTYLVPVFGRALVSLVGLIGGESTGRQLFESGSSYVAPAAERIVAIGSVLLLLLALPFGLRLVWRRYLHHPVVLVLAIAAVGYFSTLGLRLVPSAWEIGNRASEFLFIGLALITALARFPKLSRAQLGEWAGQAWKVLSSPPPLAADGGKQLQVVPPRRAGPAAGGAGLGRPDWPVRVLLAFAMLAVFCGGVIAGWLPQVRLALPARVRVGDQVLVPPGLAVARWMLAEHGSGNIVGSDESNGRYLLSYGWQQVLAGRFPNILSILATDELADWQWATFRDRDIKYMVIDRRKTATNPMLGYFFNRASQEQADTDWLPPTVYLKFDGLPFISRELDSGDIVIYNFGEWQHATAQR
jgi:hypothetical protein